MQQPVTILRPAGEICSGGVARRVDILHECALWRINPLWIINPRIANLTVIKKCLTGCAMLTDCISSASHKSLDAQPCDEKEEYPVSFDGICQSDCNDMSFRENDGLEEGYLRNRGTCTGTCFRFSEAHQGRCRSASLLHTHWPIATMIGAKGGREGRETRLSWARYDV